MTALKPGYVPVRLGPLQRGTLRDLVAPRLARGALPGNYDRLVKHIASKGDEVTIPFTAAATLASLLIDINTDWKGVTRSVRVQKISTILAAAVHEYSRHPAFREDQTGLIGNHLNTVLPVWAGEWWPNVGERQVLSPVIRRWQGTDFTQWRSRLPVRQNRQSGPNMDPDFQHLESFVVSLGEIPDGTKPDHRKVAS